MPAAEQKETAPALWLTTLGCAKNHVDSEKLIAILSEAGYRWAESPGTADEVMVNTCAFIEEAVPSRWRPSSNSRGPNPTGLTPWCWWPRISPPIAVTSTPPGGLSELLGLIAGVDGLRRLRLLYLHPREINDRLLEVMTSILVVAPYFDLSLQHVSQPLLRAMKRPGDVRRHLDLISRIRDLEPDAALRSSFIVGFPGETPAQVEELADFLEEARLDWAGFFPYSAEPGTPAATMDHQVLREEVGERLA